MSRTDAPYVRIAAALRRRIETGEFRPGDRVPSTRRIVAEWGVAMATATKVLTELRSEGLVEAVPGLGTVVTGSQEEAARESGEAAVRRGRPARGSRPGGEAVLDAGTVVRTAVRVADAEGLRTLSMRRIAGELGVDPMALYRHVGSKDELLLMMADTAFGAEPLPEPGPPGWRDRLELVARAQWRIYRKHPWVPALVASVVDPPLMPNAIRQMEWELGGFAGTGIDGLTVLRAIVNVHAYVSGVAVSRTTETGFARSETMVRQRASNSAASRKAFSAGDFPRLDALEVDEEEWGDVEAIFEFGLQRQLDGLVTFFDAGGGRERG